MHRFEREKYGALGDAVRPQDTPHNLCTVQRDSWPSSSTGTGVTSASIGGLR